MVNRRTVLRLGVAGAASLATRAITFAANATPSYTMSLRCSSIGVRVDQERAIELAAVHGFTAVTPEPNYLAKLSASQIERLQGLLRQRKLAWGAAGLPVDFRRDDAKFRADLKGLPAKAQAMQKAGVTRVGTYIMPRHDELTYVANFKQHAERLRECAKVLADAGQRLGFEYVGPRTLWSSGRYPFIHSLAETKELNAEIGVDNVGIVLDSWHWYTAEETVDDLLALKNVDVVACDLNDAPRGIAVEDQIDNQRELPATTGVIDLKAFLGALAQIGYDGPIRAEPFNDTLNAMGDELAVASTAEAMKRAFSL